MTDLIDKLSSYNVFNYLLPGVIFIALGDAITSFQLVPRDLVAAPFIYYFTGMVVSRIGSLILEPLLKKVGFLKFADYGDYVTASKRDETIPTLSEQNNTYRTLCALFVCLLLALLADNLRTYIPGATVLCVSLLVLFLFAYRKQTIYVVRRVDKALENR